MRKFYFIITVFCCLCLNYANAAPINIMMGASPYFDPMTASHPFPRVPAQLPSIDITDNMLTFPAFGSDCTLEIVDIVTEDVLHREPITAGTTSAILPSTLEGEYIIRFVFQTYMFWGYILL